MEGMAWKILVRVMILMLTRSNVFCLREDPDELFAQPANLDMVENHCPVIKQPMDFGTMRAKLHEGFYTTFDQFKRDMLLMCSNSMHTNPADSTQYKVAKAISARAKRLFKDLNAESEENGESENFSKKRRSSGRKSRVGQPRTPRSTSVSKPIERNNKAAVSEEDNRDKYFPPTLSSYSLLLKEFLEANNPNIHLIQDPRNYKDSLQMFVEELGPMAKKVAAKKLEALRLQQLMNVDQNYHNAPLLFNNPTLMIPPTPPHQDNITVTSTNARRNISINDNNTCQVNIDDEWNECTASILAKIFSKNDNQSERGTIEGKIGNVFPLGISQNNEPQQLGSSKSVSTIVRPTIMIPNANNYESNSMPSGSSNTSRALLLASPQPSQQNFVGPKITNYSIPRNNNLIRQHAPPQQHVAQFSNVPNTIGPRSFQALLMSPPNMNLTHLLGHSTSSPQGVANNLEMQENYQVNPIKVPFLHPQEGASSSTAFQIPSINGLNKSNEEGVGGFNVDHQEQATTLHLLWDNNEPHTKLSL
ncbi:hypothetical protein PIB30_005186 [Stylosanthes scabra]|uniref:Bromo domain-containing protein n=1 Tax=Stylosanthes scabra TaxID=79078 RepID=A0ABU6R609_9FABA|nr:hypothetical protein [Stylosanthes scabra]